jgi:hypothetical protein
MDGRRNAGRGRGGPGVLGRGENIALRAAGSCSSLVVDAVAVACQARNKNKSSVTEEWRKTMFFYTREKTK